MVFINCSCSMSSAKLKEARSFFCGRDVVLKSSRSNDEREFFCGGELLAFDTNSMLAGKRKSNSFLLFPNKV